MDISAALPTFAIALREGVEAALVVGIVLALLQKSQQTHLDQWVYFGVFSGLMASLLVGAGLNQLLEVLQSSDQTYAVVLLPFLKASFSLIAIAMLTWMLIWMTQQSRQAKAQIEGALTQVLQTEASAQWGIWTLVFIAVLREGLETTLFIVAQLQGGWMPVIGAITGLLLATIIGWGLFALGIRINLKRFFQVLGIFLLLIVGGLVLGFCKQIDLALSTVSSLLAHPLCLSDPSAQTSSSCILGPLIWEGHLILPESQFPGIVLKTFLGYRDHLFLGQGIAYIAFFSVAGTLYWQSLTNTQTKAKLLTSDVTKLSFPEESP